MLPASLGCQGGGGIRCERCRGIGSTADFSGPGPVRPLEQFRGGDRGKAVDPPAAPGAVGARGCDRRPGRDHRVSAHHGVELGCSRRSPGRTTGPEGVGPNGGGSALVAASPPPCGMPLTLRSAGRTIPSKRLRGIGSLGAFRYDVSRGTRDGPPQTDAVPRDSWHFSVARAPRPSRAAAAPSPPHAQRGAHSCRLRQGLPHAPPGTEARGILGDETRGRGSPPPQDAHPAEAVVPHPSSQQPRSSTGPPA